MAEPPAPPPEPTGCRFTLTGLLVILLIIGILTGLVIVPLNAAKERALRSSSASNLSQMYKAMHVYASAFGRMKGYMPHMGQKFFLCLDGCTDPAHPSSYATKSPCYGNNQLFVLPNSNHALGSMDYLGPRKHTPPGNPSALMDGLPENLVIGCDKPGNFKGGGNVVLFNGAVFWTEGEVYEAALKQTE